jgi:hypothetical protein
MSLREAVRKGMGLFLLSFGVSAPAKKPKPAEKEASAPEPRKP